MKTEVVKLTTLKPDPDNVRLHGQESIDAIVASLRAYGQMKPIVVRNNVVIAGNGTLAAAKELGWKEITIVRADHLSKNQAKAYAIADNKTSDLSMFDYERLAGQLRDLSEAKFELAGTGFREHEIEPLLQGSWTPPDFDESALTENEGDDECHAVAFPAELWAQIEPRLPQEGKDDAHRIALAILGTPQPIAKKIARRL